ncbi:MAG TPA: DUF6507 family protein [Pseudonocardiaceae bacterium]|nr:DUF6507 family protein [Pseudonocardiaceae bacterium]
MSRWDIQPAGVRGVLGQTQATAGEFEGQMTRMNSALQGAASQSSSDIVAQAISGYANQSAMPQIQAVFTRTAACLNGAAQAVNAYLEGDLQMAANAQASASAAPNAQASMPHGARVAQ